MLLQPPLLRAPQLAPLRRRGRGVGGGVGVGARSSRRRCWLLLVMLLLLVALLGRGEPVGVLITGLVD
jgi:hypothetical protein